MPVNEATLSQSHNLTISTITSSTSISSRASKLIALLSTLPDTTTITTTTLPPLLVLTAKARAANKLISIVEIVKRHLAAQSIKCYQYTALGSEIVEVERARKEDRVEGAGARDEEGESEDVFETMGAGREEGMKMRRVPILTVYLCRTAVGVLRRELG